MITESLVNTCFNVCVSAPNSYNKSKEMFSSIYSIFSTYVKNTPEEKRPLNSRNKIEFIVYLSKFRFTKPAEFSVDKVKDIISNGKYSDLYNVLIEKEEFKNPEKLDKILIDIIIPKRKGYHLGDNIPNIKQAIQDFETGSFEDLPQLLQTFETIIHKTHSIFQNLNRIESVSSVSCLDLINDDYTNVLDRYKNHCKNNLIRSGFNIIDDTLPFGGFESGRIYMFGGETGVGKSIMLLNILSNTIKLQVEELEHTVKTFENEPVVVDDAPKKQSVHLYITAENLIDESLIRYYCTTTRRPHTDVVNEIKTNPDFNIKKEVISDLNKCDNNILFYYVPARVVTLSDIESIIDDVVMRYDLKSIFIDYLDLIKSGTDSELRHELGEVTSGFKRMAILNNLPIITATQLNRSGYNNTKATFTSMSESMNKAMDTDYLAFLQRTDKDETNYRSEDGGLLVASKVRISVLKNRGGSTGRFSELVLEKTLNGRDVFNYSFKESPNYVELTDEEVKSEFEINI